MQEWKSKHHTMQGGNYRYAIVIWFYINHKAIHDTQKQRAVMDFLYKKISIA